MRRDVATTMLRDELNKYGLNDWHVRTVSDLTPRAYLGKCSYTDKTILLNIHHIDIHPDAEVINTIKHEVAHALTPGHGHDQVWAAKASEIGCDNTSVVCNLGLDPRAIEALKSNQVIETIVTETVIPAKVVREVTYKITRLQDKCPTCGKVAKELKTLVIGEKKLTFLECGHSIVKDIPKATAFESIVFDAVDPNCKHEWPDKVIWDNSKVRGTVCSKCGAKRPYQFQIDGMRFLEKADGKAAVFDEQGLGKTIQSLGYLKFHPEAVPFLWICKSGLKYQAMKEIVRILGLAYLPYVLKTGRDHIFPGFKCYIASFDILRRMSEDNFKVLSSIVKCVVIDEVQHIKNPESSRTQEVRKLCKDKQHIIPLSGTPWKNRGSEFYVVLNLIDKAKFYSFERFKANWVNYYIDDSGKTKEGGLRNIQQFKEFTKEIVIRRERAEVMRELPLINRVKLSCQMPKEAMESYDDAVDSFVRVWNQLVIGGQEDSFGGSQAVLTALNTMRQIVGIAKIPATLEHAAEFLENTEDEKRKLVIFVHHIAVAHEIYNQMMAYGQDRTKDDFEAIDVVKISSDMSSEARFAVQEKFNKDPNCRVLIASTLAAGEGLNLQTCSDCIMHERQWNPANEEQAEGRFIRIGQTAKNVNAVYAEADGTVDSDFDAIVSRKRLQFHNAMNNSEMPQWNENSLIRELGTAIAERWKKGHKK